MKKLTLDLDALAVQAFDTTPGTRGGAGTVVARIGQTDGRDCLSDYLPCATDDCTVSCGGTCDYSCNGTCAASCNGTCAVSCNGSCAASCGGTCNLSCNTCWTCDSCNYEICGVSAPGLRLC